MRQRQDNIYLAPTMCQDFTCITATQGLSAGKTWAAELTRHRCVITPPKQTATPESVDGGSAYILCTSSSSAKAGPSRRLVTSHPKCHLAPTKPNSPPRLFPKTTWFCLWYPAHQPRETSQSHGVPWCQQLSWREGQGSECPLLANTLLGHTCGF